MSNLEIYKFKNKNLEDIKYILWKLLKSEKSDISWAELSSEYNEIVEKDFFTELFKEFSGDFTSYSEDIISENIEFKLEHIKKYGIKNMQDLIYKDSVKLNFSNLSESKLNELKSKRNEENKSFKINDISLENKKIKIKTSTSRFTKIEYLATLEELEIMIKNFIECIKEVLEVIDLFAYNFNINNDELKKYNSKNILKLFEEETHLFKKNFIKYLLVNFEGRYWEEIRVKYKELFKKEYLLELFNGISVKDGLIDPNGNYYNLEVESKILEKNRYEIFPLSIIDVLKKQIIDFNNLLSIRLEDNKILVIDTDIYKFKYIITLSELKLFFENFIILNGKMINEEEKIRRLFISDSKKASELEIGTEELDNEEKISLDNTEVENIEIKNDLI